MARPGFDTALAEWTLFLEDQGMPTEIDWVLEDDVARVSVPGEPELTPYLWDQSPAPREENGRRVYEHFSSDHNPIVFRAVGAWRARSVCLVLSGNWFVHWNESDGHEPFPLWNMWFDAGARRPLERVQDARTWRRLQSRPRALSDLDFGLSHQALCDLEEHGRVLPPPVLLRRFRRRLGQLFRPAG